MLDKYVKAIVGGILSSLMSLQTAMLDGTIQSVEWVGVAIAFVAVLGGVWGIGEFNDRIEIKKVEAGIPNVTFSTGPSVTVSTNSQPSNPAFEPMSISTAPPATGAEFVEK
jgi:hypothetical protein